MVGPVEKSCQKNRTDGPVRTLNPFAAHNAYGSIVSAASRRLRWLLGLAEARDFGGSQSFAIDPDIVELAFQTFVPWRAADV